MHREENTMKIYDTLKEARKAAKEICGTYRKVSGGWAVMTWEYYEMWKNQK